ncbi:MAG: SGNH/GDSL hydrolase family protein [Kiritimatiellae bacterium]|nr:SGNH/GDSL hydrolase family protein [Kiritimatiellia bacterium]
MIIKSHLEEAICRAKVLASLLVLLVLNTAVATGGAFDKVVDDPELPRVLLIGDSISINYTPDTREILKGKVNVYRPACNCMFSSNVAANIRKWLGNEKWDVVHFNAGIWDCHFVDKHGNILQNVDKDFYDADAIRTSPVKYKENLNKIIDAIIAAGAKPVFATTTTVPRWNQKRRNYLKSLNTTARDVMFYKQIPVNDLYGYSLPYLKEWQLPDQVHFNSLGKKRLAKKVSSAILKELGSEDKVLK